MHITMKTGRDIASFYNFIQVLDGHAGMLRFDIV